MSDAAHCQHQAAGSYAPMMSSKEAEDLRRWHERAYQERRAQASRDQIFDYLGLSIVVPPDVQPVTRVSHLLGEAVLAEVQAGEKVLDMGTGSGINAILAASQSAQVVAVDVNPHALEATRNNADRNGLGDRVEVRRSDVFSAVGEVFDLIIFDPPFRWFAPRDLLEAATADKDYRVLTTFFRQARNHLTACGRMLIFFGTSGDLTYLKHLITKEGFRSSVVAHGELVRAGRHIDYFTLKVA